MTEHPGEPLRVLFLCTRNAARSQIAQALLERKGSGRFIAASAGSDPDAKVHPLAIRALREAGIDWRSARTQSIESIRDRHWDLVITVCDRARESCPTFPGRPVFADWSTEDPVAAPEDQRAAAFRDTLSYLSRRIDLMLSIPFEKLEWRAVESRMSATERPRRARQGADAARVTELPPATSPNHQPRSGAMRIALISDIHANLPALRAVLEDIGNRDGIEATYHLGDLVGYAPWPNETVALLKGFRIEGIAGNYDSTVATDYKHCGCKYEDPRQAELSHLSYEWTREHCSVETKRFLGRLPFRLDVRPGGGHIPGPTVILVHGTPTLNTLYWTEDRPDSFCTRMAEIAGARKGDVICFGHTHKPWHREVDGIHFINTGSVGRPKDGDPRAGYVILDLAGESPDVAFVRVEYDVTEAKDAIRASNLPDDFAEYLATGGQTTTVGTSESAG